MKHRIITTLAVLCASALGAGLGARVAPLQEGPATADRSRTFEDASANVQRRSDEKLAELSELRARISDEQVALGSRLREREAELQEVRQQYDESTRRMDVTAQGLVNLNAEVKARRDVIRSLSGLFVDYARNFDSRITIAEKQRFQEAIDTALLAGDNANLTEAERLDAQTATLYTGLERLEEALGGVRFEGRAVEPSGAFDLGRFLVIGPVTFFRSADGRVVGPVEQQAGKLKPSVLSFGDPELAAAASAVVEGSGDTLPVDPTLGDAQKVAAIEQSVLEEVEKGGAVMIPIFAMASVALLVALFKWLSMAFVRKPTIKQSRALNAALSAGDTAAARSAVHNMRGPVGRMLGVGVENIGQPRDLIEEVMYENVLTARFRLNRMLPFIAICAASAPLLGLLGTVTGIIKTFELINIYGSGDVKTLSGGISEALITTKYGLIVAIPSLLLHAFLSRKARGIVGQMETAAVSFVNAVSKSPLAARVQGLRPTAVQEVAASGAADPAVVRQQVSEILGDMLGPLVDEPRDSANGNARTPSTPSV
ncbi:Biopolymer transport protein ExbB [Planctomycetes bacterium Pla163]|uniref:Biopolymer transport protein ExbB n=1 Tax=Rohdeia mirabilis TaxID=2528008 RepID=A0A518CXI8_9BACT|nr:Biopolymer transport protein ExbB [Planctomycetes bacterium Pla163]